MEVIAEKTRHGFEHICHHRANALLVGWLLTTLAMTIERLYRLRYLHRGHHSPPSAAELCRRLWLSPSDPAAWDSSYPHFSPPDEQSTR